MIFDRFLNRCRTVSSNTIEIADDTVMVPACSSMNLAIKAHRKSYPLRLVIPHDIAENFLITDIKCGGLSQMIATGAVPALVFSTRAFPETLFFDPIEKGDFMIVSVTNQSRVGRAFSCLVQAEKVRAKRKVARQIVGCGSTLVDANGTVNIRVAPQWAFRPDRLVVPSTIRKFFRIDNISYVVGDGLAYQGACPSLLAGLQGTDQILAERMSFTESDVTPLGFTLPATRGQFITITTTNLSDLHHNFQAALVGDVETDVNDSSLKEGVSAQDTR
jgi:hypothetical protein